MPSTVAFFHYHFRPGGLERVMLNVLKHLDRTRFLPLLILLRRDGAFLSELPADVDVIELKRSRVRYVVRELARCLSAREVELLYSGHMWTNLASVLAARLALPKPQVVLSEHTPLSLALTEASWPRLRVTAMRHLYPRASTIGVPVPAMGDELREILRRPELRISTLLNPVLEGDVETAAGEPVADLWPNAPVIVSAGRLGREKGFDILLEAFARLSDGPERPHLCILGEGPEAPALTRLAEHLGVADRVHMRGHVTNPFSYFRRARTVVLASRRESFGNVLVEAMACGTPVIATDCWAGSRFVVDNERAGILVPPNDPAALATAITRVLNDREMANRLAAAGRRYAATFQTSTTVPVYEQLFASLIEAVQGGG